MPCYWSLLQDLAHFLAHYICVLEVSVVALEKTSRVFTPCQGAAENTVFKWRERWAGSLTLALTTSATSATCFLQGTQVSQPIYSF